MKKIRFAAFALFFLIAPILVLPMCYAADALKPYPIEMEGTISNLKSCNYNEAFQLSDDFVKLTIDSNKSKQNNHLALLERGKVALTAGNYDQCITDLQAAERRFLTTEGTISLTEGFGSLLTDDTAQEYEAEMHEKLMISPYLILAYLSKGDFNGAKVERNHTITKINQYIEENPDERAYLENPFARYLTAIMYEMENKKDDAKIEYKKLKMNQEIARIGSKKGKTTDLVILVDVGLAPQKTQLKWGPMPITVDNETISLGFAYASYATTPTETTTCDIYLDEKSLGNANLLYDLDNTIITQHEKNKSVLITKLVARMTAKASVQFAAQKAATEVAKNIPFGGLLKAAVSVAGAIWMAVEHADLRSWITLPKQIKYLRINELAPGEHTIKIDFGCGIQERKIKLEKDKIGVAYFAFAK